MELDDELYDQITALAESGDDFAEKEDFRSAINIYEQAIIIHDTSSMLP